jgi:hypothetical protein
MVVTDYTLFPTRLVTIQFSDTDDLNGDLCDLFQGRSEFAAGFNMHPDALNLLHLAGAVPAITRLRGMFLEGLKCWLLAERVAGPEAVDLVLFSNYASKGELTLVHNHNADLVGIYYARTADYDRPPIHQPGDGDDYFEAGDGVLVLHDPRFNANLAAVRNPDHVKVFPRPGLMLIFPAYLWHSVTPHLGEYHRLSFSMNFTLRWPGASVAERHALS